MEGAVGSIGPIQDVSVWDIPVRVRGNTAALARGLQGAEVTNVGLRNIYFDELGRVATTLADMGITETGFSSGVIVKG